MERKQWVIYFAFVFILLIFMAGLALVGCGVWILADKNVIIKVFMGRAPYTAAIFILVAGGIIILNSFLGCLGAIYKSKCMLLTFTIFLSILFIFLFLGGLLAVMYRNQMTENLRDNMEVYVELYDGATSDVGQEFDDALDEAQEKFQCCAVMTNGWDLYRGSMWYIRQHLRIKGGDSLGPYVPPSCCKKDHSTGEYLDLDKCQNWKLGPPGKKTGGENYALHYKGCFEVGKELELERFRILISIGIAAAILMFLGMNSSLLMLRMIQD